MRCTILSSSIVSAFALLLVSCRPDVPTDARANTGADTLTVAGELSPGFDATKVVNMNLRTFPTVTLRGSPVANLAGSADPIHSPLDLTWHGGQVVVARPNAFSRNIFINCGGTTTLWAGCWGSTNPTLYPGDFLADLSQTNYLRIADQYVGPNQGVYGFQNFYFTQNGAAYTIPFANHTVFQDDIVNLITGAASTLGASGYQNIYHVFLPSGLDACSVNRVDAARLDKHCYAPDNQYTFTTCAWHGSFDYQGKHYLFTVEPYQFVVGCVPLSSIPSNLTSLRVIDATATALAHEFFETITNPDPGTATYLPAWYNNLTGSEVADMCSAFLDLVTLRSHSYFIQELYSNEVHGCTSGS